MARSIYDGEVSAVFGYGGMWNVLVRHGAYISVYCNLKSVSVHNGLLIYGYYWLYGGTLQFIGGC